MFLFELKAVSKQDAKDALQLELSRLQKRLQQVDGEIAAARKSRSPSSSRGESGEDFKQAKLDGLEKNRRQIEQAIEDKTAEIQGRKPKKKNEFFKTEGEKAAEKQGALKAATDSISQPNTKQWFLEMKKLSDEAGDLLKKYSTAKSLANDEWTKLKAGVKALAEGMEKLDGKYKSDAMKREIQNLYTLNAQLNLYNNLKPAEAGTYAKYQMAFFSKELGGLAGKATGTGKKDETSMESKVTLFPLEMKLASGARPAGMVELNAWLDKFAYDSPEKRFHVGDLGAQGGRKYGDPQKNIIVRNTIFAMATAGELGDEWKGKGKEWMEAMQRGEVDFTADQMVIAKARSALEATRGNQISEATFKLAEGMSVADKAQGILHQENDKPASLITAWMMGKGKEAPSPKMTTAKSEKYWNFIFSQAGGWQSSGTTMEKTNEKPLEQKKDVQESEYEGAAGFHRLMDQDNGVKRYYLNITENGTPTTTPRGPITPDLSSAINLYFGAAMGERPVDAATAKVFITEFDKFSGGKHIEAAQIQEFVNQYAAAHPDIKTKQERGISSEQEQPQEDETAKAQQVLNAFKKALVDAFSHLASKYSVTMDGVQSFDQAKAKSEGNAVYGAYDEAATLLEKDAEGNYGLKQGVLPQQVEAATKKINDALTAATGTTVVPPVAINIEIEEGESDQPAYSYQNELAQKTAPAMQALHSILSDEANFSSLARRLSSLNVSEPEKEIGVFVASIQDKPDLPMALKVTDMLANATKTLDQKIAALASYISSEAQTRAELQQGGSVFEASEVTNAVAARAKTYATAKGVSQADAEASINAWLNERYGDEQNVTAQELKNAASKLSDRDIGAYMQ